VSAVATNPAPLDVARLRADFPILAQRINGRALAYLDNGASSQRPRAVIDAERRYAEEMHANVHRGVHTLSQRATDAFEAARERVRRFLNARSTREIVFTRGTTESINLVAQSFVRPRARPGD
jgi:cysteine desulfurase/selenocysteine lyase